MKKELEEKLCKDFPFMERNDTENKYNSYQMFGTECDDGWYDLLHDLCQEISDIFLKYGLEPNIRVVQIKEKFGTLRFYWETPDYPIMIHAIDGPGLSLRVNNGVNELHKEISEVVRKYEKKSGTVCEICGEEGSLRTDLSWIRTLCEHHHTEMLKKMNKYHVKKFEEYMKSEPSKN